MGKQPICKWCGNFPAVVPINRGNIGRFKREICSNCHANRLRGDMINILQIEKKRRPL